LAIEVGQRLHGEHVVEVLNRLVRYRGAPRYLFADNGAEFIWLIFGLTTMGCASTSRGVANRPTMRLSRPSTDRSRRMPERQLVCDDCRGESLIEAGDGITMKSFSHGSWKPNAARISFADKHFERARRVNGRRKLTLELDHQTQALHMAKFHTSGRTTSEGAGHELLAFHVQG
jgi:hypothetical protein